ncbi:hypothetical protein [Streptomyces prunicolor]
MMISSIGVSEGIPPTSPEREREAVTVTGTADRIRDQLTAYA